MEMDRWKINAQVTLIVGIILLCPTMLGWSIGRTVSGIMGGDPKVGGAIGAGAGLVAAAAWVFCGGWKHTKRFKALDRAFGEVSRNVNALTVEQAREAFLKSIAASPVVEVHCAASPPRLPACHADVAALFQQFDRVALRPPIRKSPSVLLEVDRVRPFENNPDAVAIGRALLERNPVVVHTPSGRVSVHRPPFKPGAAASMAADDLQSSSSIWHYLLREIGQMEFTISLRAKGMHKELDRMAIALDQPITPPAIPASVRLTESPASTGGDIDPR